MSKKLDKGIVGFAKRMYLQFVVGYKNPQDHWNRRYKLQLKTDYQQELHETSEMKQFEEKVSEAMKKYGCRSILEVGCGRGKHRCLEGWVGLDFSVEVLKQSGLNEYIVADFTRNIPLPNKSFDCVMCESVLLHVSPIKIENAIAEIYRVADKLVIISEPVGVGNPKNYSFNHDLDQLIPKTSLSPQTLLLKYVDRV